MRLVHAAALALTGWYLVIPPAQNTEDPRVDAEAPLSQWQVESSYDTAAQCEAARAEARKPIRWPAEQGKFAKLDAYDNLAHEMATCIATDDPRLKEK